MPTKIFTCRPSCLLDGLAEKIDVIFHGWKKGEKILFLLLLLNIAYSLWVCTSYVLREFSSSYGAGELLISYGGGVVRRGIVGSLLSLFASNSCVPLHIACGLLILYLLYLFCVGHSIFQLLERPWAILIFGTPSIFLFTCYHKEAFLRKDIIFIGALCLMLALIAHARKRGWHTWPILVAISPIYTFAFLVHELTLMFIGFPFVFLFGTGKTHREKMIIVAFFFVIICCSLFFAFKFSGTQEQRELILAFWKQYFPNLKTSAIEFIGSGLTTRDPQSYSLPYFKIYSLRVSIIKAWILTFIPILAIWYRYNIYTRLKILCGTWGAAIFVLQGVAALCAVIAIMNDMGRIIAFFATMFTVSALAIMALSKENVERKRGWVPNMDNYAVFLGAALYLFCWKLEHWVSLAEKGFISIQFWQRYLLLGY